MRKKYLVVLLYYSEPFCHCKENDKYLTLNLVFWIYGGFVTMVNISSYTADYNTVFSGEISYNFTAFNIISNYNKKCLKKLKNEEGQHFVN